MLQISAKHAGQATVAGGVAGLVTGGAVGGVLAEARPLSAPAIDRNAFVGKRMLATAGLFAAAAAVGSMVPKDRGREDGIAIAKGALLGMGGGLVAGAVISAAHAHGGAAARLGAVISGTTGWGVARGGAWGLGLGAAYEIGAGFAPLKPFS